MRKITDKEFKNLPKLVEMLEDENKHQLNKWGVQNRTPAEWLMFLGEEYGELCEAIAEFEYRTGTAADIVKEAIHTATLALKIAEMYNSLNEGN